MAGRAAHRARALADPTRLTLAAALEPITWNYKTYLNIAFLTLAAVLVWRFLRTGGLPMLRAMNEPAEAPAHHH